MSAKWWKEHKKNVYIYFLLPSRVFAPRTCLALASRYLHFQPLLNAQWQWCILQNLSSKLIFDYDSKYTRLFTKATFETLLASQHLAPVHLNVCTIHTWLRVSLLVCKYSAFFSPKEFGFLLLSRVAAMNKSPLLIHALSVFITFLSLRHGNVFAFFSFYAPLNKLFFCLFLYD